MADKKKTPEISEEDLENVTGGGETFSLSYEEIKIPARSNAGRMNKFIGETEKNLAPKSGQFTKTGGSH